jgi:hypothetical protein
LLAKALDEPEVRERLQAVYATGHRLWTLAVHPLPLEKLQPRPKAAGLFFDHALWKSIAATQWTLLSGVHDGVARDCARPLGAPAHIIRCCIGGLDC